jgi:hypothetical protein
MNPFPRFVPALIIERRRFVFVIYLLLTTIVLFAAFSRWGYDDPYITYRYAANLKHGLGFVYNPGEQVLSSTTPLFTLLLALFGNMWPDLPHLANLIGAFSLAIGGIFIWDLAQTWKMPLVGWSGLLLYPTFPLVVSTLSSETPIYLAFCLGAFALYARQRYALTAVCVALAILTRPDGVLVVFILAAHYLVWVRRPIPWLALALLVGLIIPWFTFAWSYFGSPLPVTLAVKQHQGAMAISQRFAPGLLTIIKSYTRWPYLLEAGLIGIGSVFLLRRAHEWILFLAWTLLYFLAYSVLGVSRYFWYYAPLVPGIIVLLGMGISSIAKSIGSSRFFHSLIIAVALLLFLVSTQIFDLRNLQQHPDNRLIIYSVVGKWLRDYTPPSASVGTLEVGIIGYYAHRRMIDFAGLIQPKVSDQLTLHTTYEDAALWAVNYYHPDYLLLPESNFLRLKEGYIIQHCNSIQRFPGETYGYSMNLNVYACK